MAKVRHAPKIHAVVAPRKKIVNIMLGKKILKVYRFSRDVPSTKVMKEVHGYDYGAWSVSDRDFTYTKEVTVWDNDVMNEIAEKTLEIYHNEQKA